MINLIVGMREHVTWSTFCCIQLKVEIAESSEVRKVFPVFKDTFNLRRRLYIHSCRKGKGGTL